MKTINQFKYLKMLGNRDLSKQVHNIYICVRLENSLIDVFKNISLKIGSQSIDINRKLL